MSSIESGWRQNVKNPSRRLATHSGSRMRPLTPYQESQIILPAFRLGDDLRAICAKLRQDEKYGRKNVGPTLLTQLLELGGGFEGLIVRNDPSVTPEQAAAEVATYRTNLRQSASKK